MTKISVSYRYSRDSGHGAWKTVELGAEADIGPDDYWMDAQKELRRQIDYQMQKLWNVKESIEEPIEEAEDGGHQDQG